MSRQSRVTADVTLAAHNMLRDYCKKHERSKGYLLEKMIRRYCAEIEVTPAVVKAPKAKVEIAVIEHPENLSVEAWDKWIAFRKTAKFKKYKSDAPMKKLAKMGNFDEQMLIVQNSIDLEYQGLFPLKANNSVIKAAVHEDALNSTDWANNMDDVL